MYTTRHNGSVRSFSATILPIFFSNFLHHIKNSEDIIHAWLDLKWNDIRQTEDIYLHYVLSLFKYSFADWNLKWNNKCDFKPAEVLLIQQRNTIGRALWTLFLIKMWKNMDYNFLPLISQKKRMEWIHVFFHFQLSFARRETEIIFGSIFGIVDDETHCLGECKCNTMFSSNNITISTNCSCECHYGYDEQTKCQKNWGIKKG